MNKVVVILLILILILFLTLLLLLLLLLFLLKGRSSRVGGNINCTCSLEKLCVLVLVSNGSTIEK